MGSPAVQARCAPPAGRGRAPLTPEQQAAEKAFVEELRKWRLSRTEDQMGGLEPFRKKFEDAGVLIQIVKCDSINRMTTTWWITFSMAKAVGAHAISCEIDRYPDEVARSDRRKIR